MIIDGRQAAELVLNQVKAEIDRDLLIGMRSPMLVLILVGDDPASHAYVRTKSRAAQKAGIRTQVVQLSAAHSQERLLRMIEQFNNDPEVDAVLVQLPLPTGYDARTVLAAVHPDKDPDGLHPVNVGRLWLGQPAIEACTPRGICFLLDHAGIRLDGKRAVIVSRSNLVGKPLAKMLLDRNATVTLAHSHTQNLPELCRQADLLVAATGVPRLITSDYVKPGAVVIDVGISHLPDGQLSGDVCFEQVEPLASAITPVPGGVGPMTVAMLMDNTFKCYLRNIENKYKH